MTEDGLGRTREVSIREKLKNKRYRPGDKSGVAVPAVDAQDPEDVRLDKAMLKLVASLLAVMAFAWIGIYLAIGLP